MSDDTIDDLHEAEDRIGLLEHTLQRLIEIEDAGDLNDVLDDARRVLLDRYCRPSCAWHETDDDVDYCGCPCHHDDDVDQDDTSRHQRTPGASTGVDA